MELLETQDPEKKRLIETSNRHKQELRKEVKDISDRSERLLINGLIIGGSLALTYFMISQWSKKSKKKKSKKKEGKEETADVESDAIETPSLLGQIGTKVLNQATLILLDIAKDKLMEYLESRKNHDENS